MTFFFLLLLCHWLADYTHLYQPYMLAAKKLGKPLLPIFHHSLIHTILVMVILVFYVADLKQIIIGSTIILVSHFLIDVWKGRMNAWFPSLQNPVNKFHWWIFGLDQTLHIVILFILYKLY